MKDNNFYKDLESFVMFEEETSIMYPWAMNKDDIMSHAYEIEKECKGYSDTDTIYFAINKICGVNPVLTANQK